MSKNTMQLELERQLNHEHRRALGDIVLTMSHDAWRRGWLIGFVFGASAVIALMALVRLI